MTPAAVLAGLVRHHSGWSLKNFCGKHRPQLKFCQDRSPFIHAMCARQSGKTQGDDGILLDNSLLQPRSTNFFLGIKGTGVRVSNWFPIWKPLLDRYGIDRKDNETEMVTTFPNAARVLFGGTDDLSNVRKMLGNRLDNSVFIIDEGQDQPEGLLRYILGTLLPPMLTPTSRVIVSGVLPDVEGGYFYELAKNPAYSHHEWGRAANVHTPEAMEQLQSYMRLHKLTVEDPQIARDWFMRRVWDKDATAYGYAAAKNGYHAEEPEWLNEELAWLSEHPELTGQHALYCRTAEPTDGGARHGISVAQPHEGIDTFSCAIDPGARDRFSVSVTGWGEETREVQHVLEWSSPRSANLAWSHVGPVLGLVKRRLDPAHWCYDAGSSLNELDVFNRDYDVPAIAAAKKIDMPGQVRRAKDLLGQSRAQVMIGSALEQDLQRARWDKDARRRQQWKWAAGWHPDPSESWRYSLNPYFDLFTPPPSDEEAEAARKAQRRKDHEKRAKPPEPEDADVEASWMSDEEDVGWE